MNSKRFEDLRTWQESVKIAVEIYQLVENNEKLKKDFGLKDQIQRAVISISSNIAEGIEYDSNKSLIKFLKYAKGSAGELRSQLFILLQINMIDKAKYEELYSRILNLSKQIASFIKYLQDYEQKQNN